MNDNYFKGKAKPLAYKTWRNAVGLKWGTVVRKPVHTRY